LLDGPVRDAGVHSCAIVPLRARGRTIGALTLVRAETAAPYGDVDLGFAEGEGIVYAFRDLTEERALDEMKTEFVSTVSHELRTPLAAIYGAAMTLRRGDVSLAGEQRETLGRSRSPTPERAGAAVCCRPLERSSCAPARLSSRAEVLRRRTSCAAARRRSRPSSTRT
jgi:signal transduction histidine kinase